ncbi:CpaF family protein [Kitasatospora sp. NPDC057936]|uniref:CpaF family protein n=1 Tax=Kitasatospora sp. NPDC057936 TaxID=3346283 RepID=UPI0036D8AC73
MRGSPLHQRPSADPAALPWSGPLPATGPVHPQPVPQPAPQPVPQPVPGQQPHQHAQQSQQHAQQPPYAQQSAYAAAPAGPTAVPSQLPSLDLRGAGTRPAVDPQVARELKRQVAAELHQQIARLTSGTGAEPDRATRRQRGRALIEEAVARWSDAYAQTHGIPPTREQDRALAEAVFDLLFRAGRLQPYLDDPEIENILINGCDDVWVSRVHQPLRQVPPVADSDAELVELLQDLARQHGGGERSLSTASPTLALRLEGGMRLQALTEVTPRPYVAIRRHRVASATLPEMVRLGTLDSTLAAFLAAAIRARKNVMITGTQGVGKTSLLRAMAAEIPPDERIGTLESEFELWLHTLGHLRQVVPMEAREGNGERVEGRLAGELTIGDLIPAALRMTLSRIIVGEVRSGEVVPMLRVMTNGEGGSMCTLHARGPHMVVDRIAELCLEYGSHMTDGLAYRLTANALDLIVHVAMVDETAVGGRRHRFVSHVLEVTGLGESGRPALNTVFGPRPELGEPRAVPHTPPQCLDDLRRAGFDASLLGSRYGSWASQLQLRIGGGAR